jgi:hypothetical protein
VAFAALGIGFTMTTGGTAMVAGDGFTITTTAEARAPGITSAANAGNVGNSTLGSLTANGYAAQLGAYGVEFNDATHFVVNDPQGVEVGHGTTAVAFAAGGLGFTITAAAPPSWPATASRSRWPRAPAAPFKAWDPANVDGSQVVAGILYATAMRPAGDKPASPSPAAAEVNQSELIFPTGANAAVIAAGVAGLKAIGILAR